VEDLLNIQEVKRVDDSDDDVDTKVVVLELKCTAYSRIERAGCNSSFNYVL
jgi:hypothetical protein